MKLRHVKTPRTCLDERLVDCIDEIAFNVQAELRAGANTLSYVGQEGLELLKGLKILYILKKETECSLTSMPIK